MKKHFVASLFIKCLVFGSAVMAQTPKSSYQIPALFNYYHQNFPQEKVYHLDKPFYASGDNIWLSAYLFEANSRFTSPLSRTLYVELIDEFQTLAKRIILPLDSTGRGKGDFKLPDSIEGGNYRIRAYTHWMRNANEAYFFDQTVPIYKTTAESVLIQPEYIFAKGEKYDTIKVSLAFKDVLDKSTAGIAFDYEFTQGKKFLAKSKQKTDTDGSAMLELLIPKETKLKGSMFLHLKVNHNETIFKKKFSIPVNPQIDVQFFPEGGDLIAGLGSRIAFKVTDEAGRGLNIKGAVFDNLGKEIAPLRTQHLGMGFTYFVPTNLQYEARIELEDGKKMTIPLPKVRENGYVLRLDNGADKLRAYIFQTNPSPTDSLTMIAQANHQIVYLGKFLPTKDFTFNIPKKDFPTGIVQFTLFDSQGKPQAERLIFSRKNDFLKIEINADKAVYQKREKAILNLSVSDPQGKPVEGTFSLTVTDSETVQPDSTISQSILSYMLINSDLRGFIEKPEYYFSEDKMADRNLDLLLMTQGWRRFEWKNILELKEIKPAEFYVERGIVLSGSVKKVLNEKPLENASVLFSHSNEKTGFQMQPNVTDQNGQYIFADQIFGEQTVFLQARNLKGGEFVKISLDSISKPTVNERLTGIRTESMLDAMAFIKASRRQYQINQTFRFELDDQMLDEVTIRAKKVEKEQEDINRPIHGMPDQTIKMDNTNTGGISNILQALQGRVAGVQIVSNGLGGFTAQIRGANSFSGSSEPLFLLDNMPTDSDMINMVPPMDVDRIEILKGATAAIYGSRGAGGVIAVYRKKGSELRETPKPNVIRARIQGFYEARQFYVPNYETPKIQHSKPDLRTTIFWNPLIKTDANGKANIEFYNADNISNFKIIVEGTNGKGSLGRGTGFYKTVEGGK